MKDKFAALIDLKSILTVSLTYTFIYLSVIRIIPVESFMVIFGMVIGWYFTRAKEPSANTITETKTTVSATTTDPEVK